MAKEIERKFIVTDKSILDNCDSSIYICQAYLSDRPEATVRIRIIGEKAFLTVKSKNEGIQRHEWEYEIPPTDAREMMKICQTSGMIEKTRYKSGRWEIDVFHGRLEGLIIAEIELENPNEIISLPGFVGRDVSTDNRYYNSCLATTQELPPFR